MATLFISESRLNRIYLFGEPEKSARKLLRKTQWNRSLMTGIESSTHGAIRYKFITLKLTSVLCLHFDYIHEAPWWIFIHGY